MNCLAVLTWPGPTPTPQDGLFALLIPTTPSTNALPGTATIAATVADSATAADSAITAGSAIAAGSGSATAADSATSGTPPPAAPLRVANGVDSPRIAPHRRVTDAAGALPTAALRRNVDGSNAPPPAAHRREAARLLLRRAAREALAAVLSMPAADISITSRPGQPPSILLANRPSSIGISFSHEEGYALAAINLHGAIGVDLMRIQDIPDWQAVARDYLGPAAAAALQASDDRPRGFAKAWTRREAALKCHAQQLSEWQAELPGQSIPLALPVAELTAHIHRC